MDFLNRLDEVNRLDGLLRRGAGLAVVTGRRRIGKTRMLVEWARRHRGIYTVADLSAPDVQRRYFAASLAERIPGFDEVAYPDWRSLLNRFAREAAQTGFRGPLVIDELPYLVVGSPELPAVLQRWVDHEGSGLCVVLAGSSQHMMHGIALAADAPLFGRASELLDLQPLAPRWLADALPGLDPVDAWTAFGGVPRYWELAAGLDGPIEARIDALVLDPLGPLHSEPDRLIAEELPPAGEARALLDGIGGGAARLAEIAGRLGRPATALSRPLARLVAMDLVRREVPFGETEKNGKRSVYRISDPLTRLWFGVVAPRRAQLAVASPVGRAALLADRWPQLRGQAWEDLCRMLVPTLPDTHWLGALGPWGPAMRWWRTSTDPEWDVVAESLDGRRLLLGECKLSGGRSAKRHPPIVDGREVVEAYFVPHARPTRGVVTAGDLIPG